MAWQSSRIIWDKNKTDSSEPQPVTIYDPTGTIYVAGNYALYSDHSGSVAENYQLYLCKVEETGSDFISSDWELQKGVKNWYLIARRQFKKGARVIKSDTNGDTASLRLYKCISSMKQPNVWNPNEWEVVYQDVGVAYEVRDHKDVYYDSGSNRNKWHKMMYYLLPENPDKSDEEIEIFSEDRVYHKDDYVIKVKTNNEVALFKYISNTPRAGWDSTRWSEDLSVTEYEANIPYNKGDWIIRKYIEIYEFVIMEFQAGLRYYNGKYCLHIINPDDINPDIPVFNENVTYSRGDKVSYNRGLWEYNLNIPLSGPWIPAYWDNIGKTFPDWYRERILGGESLYGLYRANTTVCGSWNDSEWDLIIDGVIQIRGRDYNTRGLCIMQFQIGQDYLAGDVVIWTATNDTSEFGLSVAKVDIYNCSPAQAPPNETNWNNITETLENPDQYHVYKAKANMTAGYNSHFRRDDWLIVTQKILPDDGLYGVIWEKYGKPGGGAGIPFGFPIVLNGRKYGDYQTNTLRSCLSILYPFLGNSCLEIEKDFSSNDGLTTPCTGGQAFLTTIAYKLYSGDAEVIKFMKYDLTGFHELSMTDFVNVFRYSFIENGLIYYDQKGIRASRCLYGTIYKSYFGIDIVFGKVPIVDIPKTYNISEGYSLFYSDNYWNDDRQCEIFMHGGDGVMTLVKHQTYGGISNVITSDSRMEGTTFDQCWTTVMLDKRTFCCVKDDGTIEEFDYFNDYITVSQTFDNGITQINIDDDGTNYEPYSGKMDNGIVPDKYFPSATNYSVGSENIGVCKESPWFDTDWLSFPNLEETEASIGNGVSLYNEQDNVVLNHLRLFCNQYGLTLEAGADDHYWSAKGHSYHIADEASGYYGTPTIKKEGYTYRDRYGSIYVICHKIMKISSYDYTRSQMKYKEYHQWGFVRGNNFNVFYSYFNDYYEYAPNSEKYKYSLHLIGRDGDYILAAIEGPGGATRHKINLKSGNISVSTFPMYYDLPYVGNTTFRVNGNEYSKVRVFLGINWEYYGVELPEAGDDTYVLGTIPVNTYWTPYIANIGGVCHTGDLMQIYSNWDSYWAIYVPNPSTNPIGAGGFVFGTGNYDSQYKPSPSYGGPGENGFINK